MDAETLGTCIRLLRARYAQQGRPWDDDMAELFRLELYELDSGYGLDAVRRACRGKWPPQVFEILESCADLASPAPSLSRCCDELYHKAITVGYERLPRLSHPLLSAITRRCGGWQTLRSRHWHLETGGEDKFRERIAAAYEQASSEWREAILTQLKLKATDRQARYRIGQYRSGIPDYRAPKQIAPGEDTVKPLTQAELLVRMPAEIKAMCAAKLAQIGQIGGRGHGNTSQAEPTQDAQVPRKAGNNRRDHLRKHA